MITNDDKLKYLLRNILGQNRLYCNIVQGGPVKVAHPVWGDSLVHNMKNIIWVGEYLKLDPLIYRVFTKLLQRKFFSQ